MENIIIHPNWTGNFYDGTNVALLRLTRPVDVAVPMLAAPSTKLFPNSRVFILRSEVETKLAELQVVSDDLSSSTESFGPNTFVAHTRVANMQPGMCTALFGMVP